MESATRCPSCKARIAAGVKACPGCGARLKAKPKAARPDDQAGDDVRLGRNLRRKRKKRKGPNYALLGLIGGGVLVAGALVFVVILTVQGFRNPVVNTPNPADPNSPNYVPPQPPVPAGPAWVAKADPPNDKVRPKDDLSIPIVGAPLFASGLSPFVADLVPVVVGTPDPPVISVYDMRTGDKVRTAKAIQLAQSPGREQGSETFVALGPEGKTIAARKQTTTGTGRKAMRTTQAIIYRLGQEAPVAEIHISQHLSWMEFGKDENQLLIVSAPAGAGFSAMAYDVTKKDQPAMSLEITRSGNRWRNGLGRQESLAVSPGRNYLAVGDGRSVELIQLSDGKMAGQLQLPGDCVSLAFTPDGKELAVHSQTAPQRRATAVPIQYQWTTFSMADGKQLWQEQVTGGPFPGSILAAGPKPGLAVHSERGPGNRAQSVVTDTRLGAPVYSTPFPALRSFDGDRLLGYDAQEKIITVRRIDAEQMAAGEKELVRIFGPRPAPDKADRTALSKPTAPGAWSVPIDAAPDGPELAKSHTISGGADFLMPWAGRTSLSAVLTRRVDTPRDRYPLQWQRVDLATGNGEAPVELWPSLLPPGQVPGLAGYGSVVGDQTADGTRLALRDAANQSRIDVWDQSGKRLTGFVPYGAETPVESLLWTADNRLITVAAGKVTGWEIPGRTKGDRTPEAQGSRPLLSAGPKAVFEISGYAGAFALSPGRKWIALQTDKAIDVFDTATGKALGRLPHANPVGAKWQAFAVSRDGTQLAAVQLVRAGFNEAPGIWGYATWDLKTGQQKEVTSHFTDNGNRPHHVQWLGPRLLLAGGTDVIDLDADAITVKLGLYPPNPMPSPDGRYWGTKSNQPQYVANQPRAIEEVVSTNLNDLVASMPRIPKADIIFREGTAVEATSNTGSATRDAIIKSMVASRLAAEGYGNARGGWKLSVIGERGPNSGSLDTPEGGKIPIPTIKGRIQLIDPGGGVVWETSATGGWDRYRTKYKTSTENLGAGESVTHYNFGLRDPVEAMADEAWENYVQGLKTSVLFPRVLARVGGKFVTLPMSYQPSAK
jgi:hypothetical protein